MPFFEYFFKDVDYSNHGENAVLCPFPHKTKTGHEYLETNPSAGVNLSKGIFNCVGCGTGMSEVAFIARLLNCTYEKALKIKNQFDNKLGNIYDFRQSQYDEAEAIKVAKEYGISEQVMKELDIVSEYAGTISFPVTMYDKVLDIRTYRPAQKPKVKSRPGTISGLIIPYNLLRETDLKKWILICAGEKDMAVARSKGFQAVTITGGEKAIPVDTNIFKNRKIAIVYDNDAAGQDGAKRLAAELKPVASTIRIVTGFHEICTQKGEDITDFFNKYNGTPKQLKQYIVSADEFTEEEWREEQELRYPTISLREASKPKYINKVVRSNIQVVATYDATFVMPTTINAKKLALGEKESSNTMLLHQEKSWYLTEHNAASLLHLVDNSFTEEQISKNIRMIMKIPKGEYSVGIVKPTKETIFKCTVTDMVESSTDETKPMEYQAYVIGERLESGKKYKATHKIVPHPYKGQQLFMIILNVSSSSDSVSDFMITDSVKENLDVVKNLPGTISDKINVMTDKLKGLVGYDVDEKLALSIDLTYNTPTLYHFGKFKNVRAYLDTIIVTESRIGKSSTNDALREVYGLGVTTSLAAGAATTAGIIGGSNKTTNGQFQTRAGLIPQNHLGFIAFEELAKCDSNILRSLTDIKSSNKVRITRVSGSIELPALVRTLMLTNTKTVHNVTRPIIAYPNGIAILTELIGAAEDIARFDLMYILGKQGTGEVDPFWEPEEPFPKEVYQTRIRWIWSRTPEQIIIDKEIGRYIIEECNKLNRLYNSHIKIFGTEAWKKVSRLAIAIAGYCVSTDASYENLVVRKEHVDYAVEFFTSVYDNPTFKLREYVQHERSFNDINEDGVTALQKFYIANSAMCLQLEQNASVSRTALMAATGLSTDKFNAVMNTMLRNKFIRINNTSIAPTQRFRKGMGLIKRTNRVKEVGEPNGDA